MPLIGFAGAPFTLASYLVEGGPSRTTRARKRSCTASPATWAALDGGASPRSSRAHLRAQIEAGADAVQVFDSWVGALDPRTTTSGSSCPRCARSSRAGRLGRAARSTSASGTGRAARAHAPGGRRRHRRGLANAARRGVGARRDPTLAVQGNLDPAVVLAPWEAVEPKAPRCAARARAAATGTCSTSATACCPATPVETPATARGAGARPRPNGRRRERRADRRAGDGVRDRERPGGYRALLHGHPWRPTADARSTSPSCGTRYAAIGNRFPLLDITTRQADGLVSALNGSATDGSSFRAYLGMKHSAPFVARRGCQDALRRRSNARWASSWRRTGPACRSRRTSTACSRRPATGRRPVFTFVRSFHDHPMFVSFLAGRVAHALAKLMPAEREKAAIVFSAHSLPVRTEDDGSHRCKLCTAEACATGARTAPSWNARRSSWRPSSTCIRR